MAVIPQLEVWGFSKTLSKLGETMLVAIESNQPQACVLLDVYHLYKGGSDFTGLRLLERQGNALLSHERLPGRRRRAKRSRMPTASIRATASRR